MNRGSGAAILLLASLLVACTDPSLPVPAAPPSAASSVSVSESPGTAVTIEGIHEHLEVLQHIADENGGTRAAGDPGYEASVDYVSEVLEEAGYEVTIDSFTAPVFEQTADTELEILSPQRETFEDGEDVRALLYSPAAEVEAPLYRVGSDGVSADACEPENLTEAVPGAIFLVRSGDCFVRDQVVNAQAAGAEGIIVTFPEYSTEDGVLRPTLLSPDGLEIPVLGVTGETGRALARAGAGAKVRLETNTINTSETLRSVIAESTGGDASNVVMAGGHLDSVVDGPGINDNGSGVAMLLETAEELSGEPLVNRLRFAFWTGEESGLYGSRNYVERLQAEQIEDIAVYLNFDMIASPNYVPYVYDNSGAPPGSETVTQVLMEQLDAAGVEGEPIDLTGRSDHYSFEASGVPVGGLYSGAEGLKTSSEAARYGGEAKAPLDACYHQSCDDLSNINDEALALLSNAAAAVIEGYALGVEPLPSR